MNAIHIAIVFFIAVQLLIGVAVKTRIRDVDDYLVAGRRLGWFLGFFSVFATWFGAESLVSSAGAAYKEGISWGSSEPFGYGLALVLMGAVFAVPLWRRKLRTLADFFRDRFSPATERLAALLMAPTSLLWASAQILAFAQVLSASFQVPVSLGILVAGGVVVIYTFVGGLVADVWTDAVQGVILIIGIVTMGLVLMAQHGSDMSAGWATATTPLQGTAAESPALLDLIETWAIPICGSVVAQELVSRISASKSSQVASGSAISAGIFYVLIGFIPLSLGLAGRTLAPGLSEADQVIPFLAEKYLPTYLYVLFAGALISVILSTVDSALLAAGSLVSQNLVGRELSAMSGVSGLAIARGSVAVLGVLATGLAFTGDNVYDLVEEASSFGTAGTFVIMIFGLYSGFGGKRAAIATLTVGLLSWLVGAHVLGWSVPYLMSILAALLTYVAVGLWEKRLRHA